MPIYKYECEVCGYKFEELQKISDKPIEKCPECGNKVQKMVTHSSFVLKGSGWYATDYSNKSTSLNNKKDNLSGVNTESKKKDTKNKDGKAA